MYWTSFIHGLKAGRKPILIALLVMVAFLLPCFLLALFLY